MPLTESQEAARLRLANDYNGNVYNAVTNPNGMARGGHRLNEIPLAQDVATVAEGVADLVDGVSDAIAGIGTQATSTTSVAIGTGSKTFTVQADKSFVEGMNVKIVYRSDTTKQMLGEVTSYNSGTGELVVNVESILSSGTYASWAVSFDSGADLPSPTGKEAHFVRRKQDGTGLEYVEQPLFYIKVAGAVAQVVDELITSFFAAKTVKRFEHKTSAGSVAVTLKIGSTTITGASAVTADSALTSTSLTANNVAAQGDALKWTIGSVSGATDLEIWIYE